MSIFKFFGKSKPPASAATTGNAPPASEGSTPARTRGDQWRPAVPRVGVRGDQWRPAVPRVGTRDDRSRTAVPPVGSRDDQSRPAVSPVGARDESRPAVPPVGARDESRPAVSAVGARDDQSRPAVSAVGARDDQSRPAVPPVGGRGETDLAPSRATAGGLMLPSVAGSADEVDLKAVRELFSNIAKGQATPVRTFIGDLRAKSATREWLEICRPVMGALFESATSLHLSDAARPLSDFISALDLASESQKGKDDHPIDGSAREVILEAYESLAKVLPEAFALDGIESRRETMLLHALLKQVQGVGIVTLDALYRAGLTSLSALLQASPGELSVTTGVPAPLCEAICQGLREHRLEVEGMSHLPAEQRHAMRLTELLRALAREHDEFERMAEEPGFDAARADRKRSARRNRNLCALKIEATLIEIGEVDRADTLRALSFDRRIDYLEEFLGVRVAKRAGEHQ